MAFPQCFGSVYFILGNIFIGGILAFGAGYYVRMDQEQH